MEGLMAVVYDFWKRLGRHKQRYTAVTCLIFYVIGLFFVTHVSRHVVAFTVFTLFVLLWFS